MKHLRKNTSINSESLRCALDISINSGIFFCWHPFAIDSAVDYSQEALTLVVFTLEEKSDGVLLTVIESGFDKLPPARAADAWQAHDGGWTKQMELITKYLALGKKLL